MADIPLRRHYSFEANRHRPSNHPFYLSFCAEALRSILVVAPGGL
jgi:hypothetical protein